MNTWRAQNSDDFVFSKFYRVCYCIPYRGISISLTGRQYYWCKCAAPDEALPQASPEDRSWGHSWLSWSFILGGVWAFTCKLLFRTPKALKTRLFVQHIKALTCRRFRIFTCTIIILCFYFCFRMLSDCFTYFAYCTVYFYIICTKIAIWSDLFLFTWQQQRFSWGRRWSLTRLDWALLVSLQGLQKSHRPLGARFSPRSWPVCAFASGLRYPPLNGRCWRTTQNTLLLQLCRRTPSTARLSSLQRSTAT